MIAVITGDIVNSRKVAASKWLSTLKTLLNHYGSTPEQWEIFRGDSFQLLLSPEQAFWAAMHIQSGIKLNKDLDVRMAIGIGEQDHSAEKISESNGTAFVRSGEGFETLKKQTLAINSGKPQLDEVLNLLFTLASLTLNSWSPTVASAVKVSLENYGKSQTEIASILEKSQSSLSEALKRGGFEEVMQLNEFFQKQIKNL